jgi:hypothetical protein
VDALVDSTRLLTDTTALRDRLAADGYLFFRRLLPPERILATRSAVADQLRSGGWITRQGTASAQPRATGSRDAWTDPAFRAAAASPAFNQIPYLPPLRALVRRLLGPRAFSYPVKVLRAVYPERQGRTLGRFKHYDYGVAGVQDMLTTWVPLMNIPVSLGGLAVRPGGQLGPPRRPRVLNLTERGWATTDYEPGDAIVFHCLTPHAALPNNGSWLRLSGDFRWQRAEQPAPAELVFGPSGQNWELFSRLFGRQRWWEPVPDGLVLYPRSQLVAAPPGPSGFFAVHPGWRRWKPPEGAVH